MMVAITARILFLKGRLFIEPQTMNRVRTAALFVRTVRPTSSYLQQCFTQNSSLAVVAGVALAPRAHLVAQNNRAECVVVAILNLRRKSMREKDVRWRKTGGDRATLLSLSQ